MKKSKINFIIDSLMFLVMMTIGGIGLLMKYVLIPGREIWEKYGRRVDLNLLGLDRHEWGAVHFILGISLLALLVLHIYFHWNMIPGMFCKLIGGSKRRIIIAVVFIILSIFLIAFPLLVSPEVTEMGGRGKWHHQENNH